jgi:arsenate reductase
MKSVLFLCTGNSCRSQIAEAIINHELADFWRAFSAGTAPTGAVHPMAIIVLKEIGIEHIGCSKSVNEFIKLSFDQVITVCDDADRDCPAWLGYGNKLHIAFVDPAAATGDHETKLEVFRQVRDQIRQTIMPILIEES